LDIPDRPSVGNLQHQNNFENCYKWGTFCGLKTHNELIKDGKVSASKKEVW
jgi:hypothetical protein